ncbi:MAG: hypothetical protein QG663_1058 [Thermodesulfobacteriota bacterium]|nr:hypothetical protein [Thermodesulfobacteriota bacterium]
MPGQIERLFNNVEFFLLYQDHFCLDNERMFDMSRSKNIPFVKIIQIDAVKIL